MRKFDFIVQTILMGAGALLISASALDHEYLVPFMICQFLIGLWQYGGSLIAFFFKSAAYRKRYIQVSSCYLLSLAIIFALRFPSPIFNLLYLILPAWILAIYYYKLTWQSAFINGHNESKFLPHTNF
jgi:hypothetical protein